MRVIKDWKCAWRYLSMKLALLLVFIAACEPLSPLLQQYLPKGWYGYVAILIALARIWHQPEDPVKGAARKRRASDSDIEGPPN